MQLSYEQSVALRNSLVQVTVPQLALRIGRLARLGKVVVDTFVENDIFTHCNGAVRVRTVVGTYYYRIC